MSNQRDTTERTERAGSRDRNRRRYEAPRILYEETVETMAASCNTNPGGKDDPSCLVGFT